MTLDERVRTINYNIETVNGVIYLIGIARDRDELDRVIEYARNIPYVRKVVNYVLLSSDPRRTA